MKRFLWLSLLTAFSFLPPSVASAETLPEPPAFSLKGFGTLGVARSTDDHAEYVRDLSQPNGVGTHWSGKLDSVLGLQANLQLGSNSEAVIQAVSRYRYDGTWGPELTWAFLRHSFSPDLTVRIGRLGTEFYMLADSRLVGYANLTIRPAAEYYGPLVISYVDGIDLSKTIDIGPGLLRGKLFAGYAAEKTPFAGPLVWDLHGSAMLGGHLDYLSGPWQFRIGRSQIRFKHQQPIGDLAGFDIVGLAPELSIAGTWAKFDSLGAYYDGGRLQVFGQASRIRYDSEAYQDTRAAYLVAGYRIGRITPYLGYSRAYSEASRLSTPLPPTVARAILDFTAQTHSDQHTLTLGARWDVMHNLALKAQIDQVHGKRESRFPMRNATTGWDGQMTVFSLALDFVF